MADALDPALRPPSWRRGVAFLLDAAFVAAFVALSQWALRDALGARLAENLVDGGDLYRWHLVTLSVPVWAYFVATEATGAATLGKRLMGLEVRQVGAPRVGVNGAFRRNAVKLLPFELAHVGLLVPQPLWLVEDPSFRWPLMLGALLLAWYVMRLVLDPARQGPWDRAAGTYVVRTSAARAA